MVYIKINTIVAEKRPYGYSCNRVTVRSLKSFDIILLVVVKQELQQVLRQTLVEEYRAAMEGGNLDVEAPRGSSSVTVDIDLAGAVA